MWIVRLALDRPNTFAVLVQLTLTFAPLVILRTPTDIFPNIDVPVAAEAWTYSRLNGEEFGGRVTTVAEHGLATTVHNIEHIKSATYNGISALRIYFQPKARLDSENILVRTAAQFGVMIVRIATPDPYAKCTAST